MPKLAAFDPTYYTKLRKSISYMQSTHIFGNFASPGWSLINCFDVKLVQICPAPNEADFFYFAVYNTFSKIIFELVYVNLHERRAAQIHRAISSVRKLARKEHSSMKAFGL